MVLTARSDEIDGSVANLLESVSGGDTAISARTVDAHVKRSCKKLGAARDCIETVRGVGYRLTQLRKAG